MTSRHVPEPAPRRSRPVPLGIDPQRSPVMPARAYAQLETVKDMPRSAYLETLRRERALRRPISPRAAGLGLILALIIPAVALAVEIISP